MNYRGRATNYSWLAEPYANFNLSRMHVTVQPGPKKIFFLPL